jgi:L-iditol 2-dehydrogenase
MSIEEGVFIEPLACVLRSQLKLGIQPGETILIMGSGVSGLLHAQMAKKLGASRIISTDVNDYRIKFAERFVDHSLNANADLPTEIREINDGNFPEKVIVSTSAISAITHSFGIVDEGGTILFFAPTPPEVNVSFDLQDFWNRQLSVTSSYAASPADIYSAIKLIRDSRIKVLELVSHQLTLDETGLGFRIVSDAGESMKVIVYPQK